MVQWYKVHERSINKSPTYFYLSDTLSEDEVEEKLYEKEAEFEYSVDFEKVAKPPANWVEEEIANSEVEIKYLYRYLKELDNVRETT